MHYAQRHKKSHTRYPLTLGSISFVTITLFISLTTTIQLYKLATYVDCNTSRNSRRTVVSLSLWPYIRNPVVSIFGLQMLIESSILNHTTNYKPSCHSTRHPFSLAGLFRLSQHGWNFPWARNWYPWLFCFLVCFHSFCLAIRYWSKQYGLPQTPWQLLLCRNDRQPPTFMWKISLRITTALPSRSDAVLSLICHTCFKTGGLKNLLKIFLSATAPL